MDNYFSNRITIEEIKSKLNSRFPPGDARLGSYPPGVGYQQIQRLSGFATAKVPTTDMFASSGGTESFPNTKGQLVIVTDGYDSDGNPYADTNPLYNSIFTGDMRLLDGGKHPIGQTFPPIGSLGYFAYNGVPNGWLELKGQGLLYLKSKFYDINGVQLSTRVDDDFAYEVTQDTEYTPLFNILYSWGIVKTTPSNNGWNFFLPKWQGYFIRSINPSSTGVDPNSRIWHPTERTHINASRVTDSTPTFGHIPVLKHKHYSKVLQRHFRGGRDIHDIYEDWGTQNFMRFWRHTQNTAHHTASSHYGITGQSNNFTTWADYIGHHNGGKQSYNFHPFLYSNSGDRYGMPHFISKTGGHNSSTHRNFVVGGFTKYLRKRYYGDIEWNDVASVDFTSYYHDGERPDGWTPRFHGVSHAPRDSAGNTWWANWHWNEAYFEDTNERSGAFSVDWWASNGRHGRDSSGNTDSIGSHNTYFWQGFYRMRRWHWAWDGNWFAQSTWGTITSSSPAGNRTRSHVGAQSVDNVAFLPFKDYYGNESTCTYHAHRDWADYPNPYKNVDTNFYPSASSFGFSQHASDHTPHNQYISGQLSDAKAHQGRLHSFRYHFHNEVNTYWRAKENWWGAFLHSFESYLAGTSDVNDRYRDWNNGWNDHYYYWWWFGFNRNRWYYSQGGHASWWRRWGQYWTFPYHIKRSPAGTNDGTEILNTGNDGDPTSTSGNHRHSIHDGNNGIFARGDFESRPNNIALRLCIKY